jgi:hypothetical protein
MNIDDPKLTAFALDELDEPERSTIAHEVAESPEAQRVITETRELARALKNEFTRELNEKARPSRSLSDIRDDPWFWSIGRPLAIAALIAIFAVLGALVVGSRSRRDSNRSTPTDYAVLESEEKPRDVSPKLEPTTEISNPLRASVVAKVEEVVVGELAPDSMDGELRVIERINDAYRIQRLKQRMSIPVVSKKSYRGLVGGRYELMFMDHAGRVVASAHFDRLSNGEYMLQPLRSAFEKSGRYYLGGSTALPGDWREDIDYREYSLQFPDWSECIGYAPGA